MPDLIINAHAETESAEKTAAAAAPHANVSPREERLREQYGEVLTPKELAEILRYPSEAALLKADQRGTLPIRLARFRHRRGRYATVGALARCLDELDQQSLWGREMRR